MFQLIEAEFDVADSLTLEAMAHGFGFVFERLLDGLETPIIPVIVNVHGCIGMYCSWSNI